MSTEKKIQKLFEKLKVDGEDIYDLAKDLKIKYEIEDDYDEVLSDLIKVKDDIIKVVSALKKELM